jgi:hypothetical protein
MTTPATTDLLWGNNPLESMGETYQVSLFLLLFFTTSLFVAIFSSLLASCELAFVSIHIPSLSLSYLPFDILIWVCFGALWRSIPATIDTTFTLS